MCRTRTLAYCWEHVFPLGWELHHTLPYCLPPGTNTRGDNTDQGATSKAKAPRHQASFQPPNPAPGLPSPAPLLLQSQATPIQGGCWPLLTEPCCLQASRHHVQTSAHTGSAASCALFHSIPLASSVAWTLEPACLRSSPSSTCDQLFSSSMPPFQLYDSTANRPSPSTRPVHDKRHQSVSCDNYSANQVLLGEAFVSPECSPPCQRLSIYMQRHLNGNFSKEGE